jgi:hypothetical protein
MGNNRVEMTAERPIRTGVLVGRSYATSPAFGLRTGGMYVDAGWPCMVDGSLRRDLCDAVACAARCKVARCRGLRDRLLAERERKARWGR